MQCKLGGWCIWTAAARRFVLYTALAADSSWMSVEWNGNGKVKCGSPWALEYVLLCYRGEAIDILVLSSGERTDLEEARAVGLREDVVPDSEPLLELSPMALLRRAALLEEQLVHVAHHGRARTPVALGVGHAPSVTPRRARRFDARHGRVCRLVRRGSGGPGLQLLARADGASACLPVVVVLVVGEVRKHVGLFLVWVEHRHPAHTVRVEDHVADHARAGREGAHWRAYRRASEVGDEGRTCRCSVEFPESLVVPLPLPRGRVPLHLPDDCNATPE